MASYLVIVHSIVDGAGLRQFVVDAEDAADAVSKYAGYAGALEHLVAIPTGSVPDTAPPAEETEPAVAPLLGSAPEPVAPAEEVPVVEEAEGAVSKLVALLKSVDPTLLADVLSKLR
jgi:hypothetical protein